MAEDLSEAHLSEYIEIISDSPAHGAVMDNNGIIMAVNHSWIQFGLANGLDDSDHTIGKSYLDICLSSSSYDYYSYRARTHLYSVLEGKKISSSFVYPCHSPTEERWFLCKFYKVPGGVISLHFRVK